MRYLVGFTCVLAFVASPLSVSAQTEEEPALQLQLDEAGVQAVPSAPRTDDGYTLEEMDLRVKRAKNGLYASAGIFAAGLTMGFIAMANHEPCFLDWECPEYPDWVGPVGWTGAVLAVGGFAGILASSVLVGKRNRERDSLRQAHYGTSRRVQWDLARSALVF